MNITPWQMYWLTRLDGVNALFGTTFVISLIALIISSVILLTIYFSNEEEKMNIKAKKFFLNALWIFIFSNIGWFIPCTKEMAAIMIVPSILNNQKVKELPDKILTLADDWIKELSPSDKATK